MKNTLLAALVVASLGGTALAIDLPLPNGGFDVGSPASNSYGLISNWNVQSVPTSGFQSGVFTSYAGYAPNNGARLGLITNAGATPATTPLFVQLRNVVPVELFRMPYFNFHFAFLTTDPNATLLANRDQFRVVIDYFSDAGGLNQIGTESFTLDTGTLTSTGVALGAGQAWPAGTVLNGTLENANNVPGRLQYTVLPIGLTSAPYANFTFYLDNLGTSGQSVFSGVLIDNVYINPEPGTLALFGLGAAGLGAMAWRRRKSAKAKKPA